MKSTRRTSIIPVRARVVLPLLLGIVAATVACGHVVMAGRGVQRPAAEAFGFGPRVSENHTYTATLQPQQPLRVRRLQTVPVLIMDAQGHPVDDAVISIDGGMPEHGHGLPTNPRIARALGGGAYEIEGLRFNMGGWWELKLAIDSPVGSDRVTFNLNL